MPRALDALTAIQSVLPFALGGAQSVAVHTLLTRVALGLPRVDPYSTCSALYTAVAPASRALSVAALRSFQLSTVPVSVAAPS